MAINYGFTPTGAQLTTEAPDIQQYLAPFLAQREEAPRRPYANNSIVTRGELAARQQPGAERNSSPLELAQREAQMAQLRAVSGRAPLRTSYVAGQRVDTPDENAMTGAQRQAFLPQGASMGAFGPSGASLAPLEQRGGPRDEGSQFGYDYLSPVDQARYRAALQRTSGVR